MNRIEYSDKVVDYLEYLGYADLVIEFDTEAVARSMHQCIKSLYGVSSYRFCALLIFGATMVYQIVPRAHNGVKH